MHVQRQETRFRGVRRATEDAPESSTRGGAGRWSAKRKVSVVLELFAAPTWRALRGNIELRQPPSSNGGPRIRSAALWCRGSRKYEPHRFAFHEPSVRCGAGRFRVEPGAVQLLRGSPAAAASAATPRAQPQGALRRRADSGDPRAVGETPFHWRGVSQDLGQPALQGRAHFQGPRPPACFASSSCFLRRGSPNQLPVTRMKGRL
jgi:hypothetical protein